jgi:hypothetical protein
MVLPNSTTQQRWQQKPPMKQQQQQQQLQQQPPLIQSNQANQKYMNQKQQNTNNINNAQMPKKQKQSHNNNNINNNMNTPPSSNTIVELPETFGLPSNNQSNSFNSYKTSSSYGNKNDILLDDKVTTKNSEETIKESDNMKKNVKSPNSDIEIISEAYPTSNIPSSALNNNNNNSRSYQSIQQQQQDELFKQYLAKNYNTILAVTTKPQSNFISNFSCLNQALNQISSGGFYDNKLKRSKPYSANIKLKDIDSIYKQLDLELDREDGEEGDEDEEMIEIDASGNETKKKLNTTKLIVIDDTGDEMHKPWITPELINLIKHRNLLSAKINEKNLMNKDENANGENDSASTSEADAELIQKFKNLRNKVTKLVKKARSMYSFLSNMVIYIIFFNFSKFFIV